MKENSCRNRLKVGAYYSVQRLPLNKKFKIKLSERGYGLLTYLVLRDIILEGR